MPDFTPAEAAKELAVSRGLIYDLCGRGEIPHQRYGKPGSRKPRITFTAEQLEQIRRQFAQQPITRRQMRVAS